MHRDCKLLSPFDRLVVDALNWDVLDVLVALELKLDNP